MGLGACTIAFREEKGIALCVGGWVGGVSSSSYRIPAQSPCHLMSSESKDKIATGPLF